jgi:hypothetical protein
MSRLMIALVGCIASICATAAPVPKPVTRSTGVLILDNCDAAYEGKEEYKDNLTLLTSAGKPVFRVSGFNNCESIGGNHMIAVDSTRRRIWVVENVAHRIRCFDFAGKETLRIPEVRAKALAVDQESGNLWALVGENIVKGRTVVFDSVGKEIASYEIVGWDLVYDRHAKAFWIAAKKLTKIVAATGKIAHSTDVAVWCASSVDVDPRTGSAWVGVREHPNVAGSRNRLLKFGPDGKESVAVELGPRSPSRVSVESRDGGVWVAFGRSVGWFSADGKAESEYAVEARSVQVDPAGGVWIITSTEAQKLTSKGEVTARVKHAGTTSQAWIAALE